MTGNLYWLASYPKSGNTWMRILLTNYFRDRDEPADINLLDDGPMASARNIFDDNVGIEASDLTQDEIERLRPYVYELISEEIAAEHVDGEPPSPAVFMKVHDAYIRTQEGIPLLSKAATAGAVYMLRNPLDVAVSFAHHTAQPVDKAVKLMGRNEAAFIDHPQRLHLQLRQRLLTWSKHVTSWLDEPNLRVLPVRYEDLLADTALVFSEVLGFAGLDAEPSRVRKAVEFSRFDRLQAQEAEVGFGEKFGRSEFFFRKGEIGSWRDALSDELVDQICTDHGEVMARFGYAT